MRELNKELLDFSSREERPFNVLFAEYIRGADPTEEPNCYKLRVLQQTVPDGWDKTSRASLPGNTIDNIQFSLLARRMAWEITMFCRQDSKFPDVRALACFPDLIEVMKNPCIPNPAYALLTILRINHDHGE